MICTVLYFIIYCIYCMYCKLEKSPYTHINSSSEIPKEAVKTGHGPAEDRGRSRVASDIGLSAPSRRSRHHLSPDNLIASPGGAAAVTYICLRVAIAPDTLLHFRRFSTRVPTSMCFTYQLLSSLVQELGDLPAPQRYAGDLTL